MNWRKCLKVVVPKIMSLKKKFFYDLRLKIKLSAISHERKNIIFHEKNFKLTKNNTFDNVFRNWIFLYYRFLPIFFKLLAFHKSWLIFSSKVSSTTWKSNNLKKMVRSNSKKKLYYKKMLKVLFFVRLKFFF